MVTEHAYETAKAKLAEYESRKDATLKAVHLTLPSEMGSNDKQVALDRVKDALADAYYLLVITCNEAISSYERNDLFEHQRMELSEIEEFYHA